MSRKSIIAASLASLLAFTSCNHDKGWVVEGIVKGAEGQKIALQAFNNSYWYTIDSLDIASNGAFKYASAAPAPYPEVYRLSLDGSDIYFPVDSVSKIYVKADASSFSIGYSLTGTESARRFAQADSMIAAVITAKGEQAAASDSLLKRNLTELLLNDDKGITAYYIINKRIGGKAIFDPANNRDLAVIGAVAQNFITNSPEDPRTALLRNLYISAKAALSPATTTTQTIEIAESGLPYNIRSFDNKGVEHSLFDAASKGNVVLLSFSSYDLENSPAYNLILANLYKKYHDRGLEIFQVAFDNDEAQWKQSAVNLPWITVWNSPEDGNLTMISYNVNVLPLTYIIDRSGAINSRVTDPTVLDAELAKII